MFKPSALQWNSALFSIAEDWLRGNIAMGSLTYKCDKNTPQQHLRYSSATEDSAKKLSIYCTHHGTGTARYTHRETQKKFKCIQQTWCIVPVGERTWALAFCGSCWTCDPVSWGWGWERAWRPPMTSRWWAASPWCNAVSLDFPWWGCHRGPV